MSDKILEVIKSAKRVAILVHESPDGDAIGSALATLLALRKINIDADAIVSEYPFMFKILDKIELFKTNSNLEYDVALVLDCSSVNRISNIDIFNKANITINIDHHDTNTSFATYNLVDRGGPACCLTLFAAIIAVEAISCGR